jgi:nucleotide-binding universal stress UspA family protein
MKLICATDFSEAAARAAAVAAVLARRLGDSLELVHVLEPPSAVVPELSVVGPSLLSALREQAEGRLVALSARLAGDGLSVEWRTLEGVAEATLLAHAQEQQARLLVLGTHGRRPAARAFLGSVSERVVRKAHVPVLVVPERAATNLDQSGDRPLRILAGVDASPASDAAMAWLRALPIVDSSQLSLVHVYWPLREYSRFGIEDAGDGFESTHEVELLLAQELRPRLSEILGELPVPLRFRAMLGSEADPIAREAERIDADLLVVGTNQRHDRWSGSTAVSTIRAARRPVIVVPALAPHAPLAAERVRPLRSLLVPVDLGEASGRAVAMAHRMLHAGGGLIQLLHVVKPSAEGLASTRGGQLEQQLRDLVSGADAHGVLTRTMVVESDSPATAILQAAERLAVDAIVMASHGHGGVKRALLGSVAEHVVRDGRRPVTVVPPPAGQ